MNILVLTIHADPTIHPGAEEGGGTHLYVNEIINLLIYKQINSLFITRKASPGKDNFEYGTVSIARIRMGPEAQWNKNNLEEMDTTINKMISKELKLRKFIPDLIHSIYWCSGRAALFISERYNIPFIHTIISNGYRKKITGYYVSEKRIETEIKIFHSANILISVSNQEKEDLIHFYNVPASKIMVIGRGVDNIFLNDLYDSKGTLLPKLEPNIKKIK